MKKKVKKALFYPAAVLVVAFIVTVILLIFVIPQFQKLFKGFGADLPAFTQFVINLSEFVQHKGIYLAIVARRRVAGPSSTSRSARARCARSWTDIPEDSHHRPDPQQGRDRALRAHARPPCSPPACRSWKRWNPWPAPAATSSTRTP